MELYEQVMICNYLKELADECSDYNDYGTAHGLDLAIKVIKEGDYNNGNKIQETEV